MQASRILELGRDFYRLFINYFLIEQCSLVYLEVWTDV